MRPAGTAPRRRRGWLLLATVLAGCPSSLPDADSPGARLYADRCAGSCHRLYQPGTMKFEMWKIVVRRMQGEMVRRGARPLNEEEQAVLLDYLRRHST